MLGRVMYAALLAWGVWGSGRPPEEKDGAGTDDASCVAVMFPLLFHNNNLAMQATERFSEVPGELSEAVKSFVGRYVPGMVLANGVYPRTVYRNPLFRRVLGIKDISMRLQDLHKRIEKEYFRADSKATLSDLLKMLRKEMFEDRGKGSLASRFRECIEKIGRMEVKKSLLPLEEKAVLRQIENSEANRHSDGTGSLAIEAEEVMCNGCCELCKREKDVMGLVVEGRFGKDKGLYLNATDINGDVVVNAMRDYGMDVVVEIVRQMLLGKSGREIDKEYVETVVQAVSERKARREEEDRCVEAERVRIREEAERMARKAEEELLRELGVSGSGLQVGGRKTGRPKKSRGVRGKGLKRDKEREDLGEKEEERQEASEKVEVKEAVEINTAKDVEEDVVRYGVHKRVRRWRDDPKKIREVLRSDGEPEWRWRNEEVVKRQKKTHDILEVIRLLQSSVWDKFFVELTEEENLHEGKSYRATARLWEKGDSGDGELGLVEVCIGKDKGGRDVIYHLMFRPTKMEDIAKAMKEDYAGRMRGRIEKSDVCSSSEDLAGFSYAGSARSGIVWREDLFEVEWGDPGNALDVQRRLTVFGRPRVIEARKEGERGMPSKRRN